jgi:hypothetical protein
MELQLQSQLQSQLQLQSQSHKQIVCNVSNDELSSDKWTRIQLECIKNNHLGKGENIFDIIEHDNQILKSYGISHKQIYDFFMKITYHFDNNMGIHNLSLTNIDKQHIKKIREREIKRFINLNEKHYQCIFKIKIFNDNLEVIRITWGGADMCLFQSISDKKYHGYEYGSHDWIFHDVKNDTWFYIADLLFHQIGKHNFFQGFDSNFRVNPHELIKFFRLKPDEDYSTEKNKVPKWDEISVENINIDNNNNLNYVHNFIGSKYSEIIFGNNRIYYNSEYAIIYAIDKIYSHHVIIDGKKADIPFFMKRITKYKINNNVLSEQLSINEINKNWF